jgi:hypothetical protein
MGTETRQTEHRSGGQASLPVIAAVASEPLGADRAAAVRRILAAAIARAAAGGATSRQDSHAD